MPADISEALEALRRRNAVIVVDDEDRENEGDIILAAEHASTEWLAWIIQVSSGFVCAPMRNGIADMLKLPLMTQDNKDALRTAYAISVDAADGVTTAISAKGRARTLRVVICRSHRRRRGHDATARTVCFRAAERAPCRQHQVAGRATSDRGPQQQQPDFTHPVSTSEYLIGHTKEET